MSFDLTFGFILAIDQLKDERSSGDNSRATGQEVAANKTFQDTGLARGLSSNYGDLWQVKGQIIGHQRVEFVLQFVDHSDQIDGEVSHRCRVGTETKLCLNH